MTLRLGHQVRAQIGALGGKVILGFDMTAALALSDAMGIPPAATAALLPEIEAAAIPAMNTRLGESDG